jgi:26S proteasome regulatory subunit N5
LLRTRLLEHNIRIISLYYDQIGLDWMAGLVGCPAEECEGLLCGLMNGRVVACGVDRIDGVIDFRPD